MSCQQLLSLFPLLLQCGWWGIFTPSPALGEAGEEFFVGQLRTVELHLNFFTVDGDVTLDPEGNGVFDPGLGRPTFGQLPLEVLALVVLGVSGQQALSSDQLSRLAQLGTVLARQLDPNLGEPAPLGACTVELEVTAQLSEAQRDNVQATAEHKAQSVLVGGTAGAVGNFHFGHGHRGQSPFLYLTVTL